MGLATSLILEDSKRLVRLLGANSDSISPHHSELNRFSIGVLGILRTAIGSAAYVHYLRKELCGPNHRSGLEGVDRYPTMLNLSIKTHAVERVTGRPAKDFTKSLIIRVVGLTSIKHLGGVLVVWA